MSFFQRIFGSSAPPSMAEVKPGFDASVAQRLAAAGKDPNRVEAIPAELLEMPAKPAMAGFSGMVRFELTLDAGGLVVAVQMDGAPYDQVSTLEAWAGKWTFIPAKMEGKAHPCRMVFEITWSGEPK